MINIEFINKYFKKGELTIIGGRPGIGKTSLGASLAKSLAESNLKSIYFSIEMTSDQLIQRIKLQVDELRYDSLKSKIHIDDTPCIKLSEIGSILEKWSGDYVIIDYLQLIDGEVRTSRSDELSTIIKTLKLLSQKLNIAIIALSSLTRDFEKELEGTLNVTLRPTLASLGSLNSVWIDQVNTHIIHRPNYYRNYDECNTESGVMERLEFLTYIVDKCHTDFLYLNNETKEVSDCI